jgi:HK97 family phage major capsid protein
MTKVDEFTVPETADELAEMLGSTESVNKITEAGALPRVIEAYAQLVVARDTKLVQQLNEATQQGIVNWLRENPNPNADQVGATLERMRPDNRAARRAGAAHSPRAAGAALDSVYARDMGDALRQVFADERKAPMSQSERQRLLGLRERGEQIYNSFSSVVPDAGGFLIPEVLRSEILSLSLETGVVRSRATVIPMDSLRVPIPTVDATSNASSVFGGMVAYWTEEAAALTESQAAFAQVVLDAHKLTLYFTAPSELLADASAFLGFVDARAPLVLAYFEDLGFQLGSGVGEPLGALTAANTALVSQAAEAGQGTATIMWENIVKMYSRMLPQSLNSAVWVVSPATFPELATMALSVGTGGSAIWLNSGSEGPPMTILGRPVTVTEKVPTLGTAGDVNFVDYSYYLIGDRMAMTAASSTDYLFGTDKVAFRLIERVDGRPWLNSAMTPRNSGPTLSPFVSLAARP